MTPMTAEEYRTWEWVYERWGSIAYRTKKVVAAAVSSPWTPRGEGRDLSFERIIEFESTQWPPDREIVRVQFDHNGNLRGCQRSKVIQIESGRSHADLCRMLGIEEPK